MVAEIVHRSLTITKIVLEPRSFNKDIHDFSHYIGAELLIVDSMDELLNALGDEAVGVSYGFGVKFSKQAIDHFSDGIINIHTGDLPKYRSRHPITWAMINGDAQIGVTIHKINEKFDSGLLVHKYFVERSFFDDLGSIESKIEAALKVEFPKAFDNLITGKLSALPEGGYLKRIDQTFANVDPSEIQSRHLFSLFRSQRVYGGVNVLGKKRLECRFYDPKLKSHYAEYQIFSCKDDVLVAIK